MPLSDRDQRVLEDIERGLHLTAPKRATSMLDHRPRSKPVRTFALIVSAVTIGLVLVLSGLVANLAFVAILGYVLIVGAITRVSGPRSMAAWISRFRSAGQTDQKGR